MPKGSDQKCGPSVCPSYPVERPCPSSELREPGLRAGSAQSNTSTALPSALLPPTLRPAPHLGPRAAAGLPAAWTPGPAGSSLHHEVTSSGAQPAGPTASVLLTGRARPQLPLLFFFVRLLPCSASAGFVPRSGQEMEGSEGAEAGGLAETPQNRARPHLIPEPQVLYILPGRTPHLPLPAPPTFTAHRPASPSHIPQDHRARFPPSGAL